LHRILPRPPLPADHDFKEAAAFAGVICSSPEAVAAYLGFARIETQAILRDHQHVVFALAKALKVRRTLGATEIDEVIGDAVDQKALADERARRAEWRQVTVLACRQREQPL
jgi:hypothetical protein